MFVLRRVFLLSLVSLLGACTTFHTSPPRITTGYGPAKALKQTYYSAEVTAADNTKIRMTVYQPRLRIGQTAPLLIHAHGFGLGRMARPLSLYGQLLLAGKVSKEAWKDGYWVISYDQRGFGSSEGTVSLISPEKEGEDVARIVDWAVRFLPVTLKDNDPVVGMIGESYGAGAQYAATVADKRIDALVPLTGWYDLDEALFPNGVPKSDWLTFLGIAGFATAPLSMDSDVTFGVLKELFSKGDPELRQRLRRNSLAEHCGAGTGPHADALMIQGFRDVLFNFNQALQARDCFQRSGREARLIGVEDGHLMLGSQLSPGLLPLWHVQKEVVCNGKVLEVDAMIHDWLNGKLRADKAALARVPHYCVTGDKVADAGNGQLETVWQDLPKAHVGSGSSGMFELALQPLDSVGNWFLPAKVPADWQQPENGWLRPARIPLMAPATATWVVGTPKVELTLSDTDRDDAVVFLRLAVWKPGSGSYRVLNQQVTPVHAKGPLKVDLGGVKVQVQPGEVLGLLAQGYSNQFRLAGSGLGTDASISGRIALPIPGRDNTAVAQQSPALTGAEAVSVTP